MSFDFGSLDAAQVLLLEDRDVSVALSARRATYVLFVHVVEDVVTNYLDGFADSLDLIGCANQLDGYELGTAVSEYVLEYEDGSTVATPILRRFAIQQARFEWGSGPFACVAAVNDVVFRSTTEAFALGEAANPELPLGLERVARDFRGMTGGAPWVNSYAADATSNQKSSLSAPGRAGGMLWVYALANPNPELPLRRVICRPRDERSAIYAVSLTELTVHPLRPGLRRKLRLPLPDDARFDVLGEIDDIGIDLGIVISARAALDYDHHRWIGSEPIVEPRRSEREVIVEYAAHQQARLKLGEDIYELDGFSGSVSALEPADRPVRLRFLDADSGASVAVRLHLHGEAGEYLPPRGYHRKVDAEETESVHPEFVNVENQYAYVDGECVADLPVGTVFVEVSHGLETEPIRTSVEVGPETNELTFELKKGLRWRERGWVTADTHVHFLSPQTALLVGKAEGVNVVNVLASQWGEGFSNVGDFDGKTTFGAADCGESGEFLVRVGSENRMNILGHISLLGYEGELIQPLCTGGPEESAFGDPVEVTMAEWARRCLGQGGLVVMPHSPIPQAERAADIVLGLVDAIELLNFNPLRPELGQLSAYGIADWYRYLNLGYQLPLVGGSDRETAGMLLGGVRTYAWLGDRELTYDDWMDSIRAGNTFVTVGPLLSLRVDGVEPGGQVQLPAGGRTVELEWEIESVRMPIDRIEIVVGGLVAEEVVCDGHLSARGRAQIPVSESTWVALRVRGSYHGRSDDIAAHTSAVQLLAAGSELFSEADSLVVLHQIQGTIAFVDTLAPRPGERRFRELRATLEAAYNCLRQRMQAAGIEQADLLHDPGYPHEH